MKVLLLSPPVFDFYFTPGRTEPLGLLYIKSALRAVPGVEAAVYDAAGTGRKKRLARPGVFAHTDDFYGEDDSCFSLLGRYQRFGDSFGRIAKRVREDGIDLVGISAMFSGYYPDTEDLIARLKSETGALVSVGGWAVEAEGERLFASSRADFFLRGSGEASFPALVRALLGRISLDEVPGLIRRGTTGIESNPPVCLPLPEEYPDRESVYRLWGQRIAKVVLSRGCPHRCRFCAVGGSAPFSLRSLDSIGAELEYLAGLGVGLVDFEDDNILCRDEFTEGLIPLLRRFRDRGMSFAAMNGMTAVNVLPRAGDLVDAGFVEFNLSLVAGSGETVSGYQRPFGREAVSAVVRAVGERVKTLVYLIAGLPGSSPDAVLRDIQDLAGMPATIGISPLYLVPGVPLFEEMGLPGDRRLLRGSALYRFGDSFTREQVASLWRLVRMINRVKTGEGLDTDGFRENLEYFRRSLGEGNWYRKARDGSWEKGARVMLQVPRIGVRLPGGGTFEI